MEDISTIDKNFAREEIKRDDMKLYDIRNSPFRIYGLYHPEISGKFRRLPETVAKNMSDGAHFLHTNTSGGRVRFKTDSKYVALKAELPSICIMPHMAATGSCGFDMYADNKYTGTFIPPITYVDNFMPTCNMDGGYESILEFEDCRMRDIIINFPTYNDVTNVTLGLQESATVSEGNEYSYEKPIVFYGSSITQGGCTSRPGNTYQSVLSRRFDADFTNLGFSGNARAEDAISEYISDLDMKIFVYDYDHNAPDVDYLNKTHYKMYKKIRDKQPGLPIILASRPSLGNQKDIDDRKNVIMNTYNKAKADGDNNIYFVNGQEVLDSYDRNICTVDGCHPNDFGFFCMAEAFGKIIEKLL